MELIVIVEILLIRFISIEKCENALEIPRYAFELFNSEITRIHARYHLELTKSNDENFPVLAKEFQVSSSEHTECIISWRIISILI